MPIMELREYIAIFKKNFRLFWTIVFVCFLMGVAWQKNQPESYQATLLLDIGRTGIPSTGQYTYDSFYRLQADERFADTVVRWLGNPRVVEDIFILSGHDMTERSMRSLKNIFKPKRLSSQVIEVGYKDEREKDMHGIATAATTVLNRYAKSLNQENEPHWFVIIGSDPVIRDARLPLSLVAVASLFLGVFIGFWGVLLRHYMAGSR